jgi:hypothetical protein
MTGPQFSSSMSGTHWRDPDAVFVLESLAAQVDVLLEIVGKQVNALGEKKGKENAAPTLQSNLKGVMGEVPRRAALREAFHKRVCTCKDRC